MGEGGWTWSVWVVYVMWDQNFREHCCSRHMLVGLVLLALAHQHATFRIEIFNLP